jgi:hypothetical protein
MDPFNVARHSLVMDAAKCETREVLKGTEDDCGTLQIAKRDLIKTCSSYCFAECERELCRQNYTDIVRRTGIGGG